MSRVCLALLLASPLAAPAADPSRRPLEYAPAPADNPLKGLVPYAGDWGDRFPHSLEFDYLPLSKLVAARGRYDWKPLDRLLDTIAGRGHQAVLRVYVEYPGKADGIPPFLVAGGLKVHRYRDRSSSPPVDNLTPDYADPNLRAVLREFVASLGKRYDGDPRLGYLTAGLLGHWGEWHTYPREDLYASKEVQAEVMDAYEAAFRATPLLLRYPVGANDATRAPNAGRRFGYHDDSFAWATLDTGRPGDEWFYLTALKAAGPDAMAKWRTRPIGGEIRPEAWGRVFDERPGLKEIQDFRQCVEQTHATWLMDSGMFEKKQSAERRRRAEDAVRRMGYEFHAPAVTIGEPAADRLSVVLELENRGVAPFYAEWPAEFGAIAGGEVKRTWRGAGRLTGLLPGDPPRAWRETLDLSGLSGTHRLAVRVPNPLPGGRPLRFANREQDADLTGWLTLGEFRAP